MKTFRDFLLESVSPDTKGKIHELLVAKHLNGGKHISPEAHAHFKALTANIHPDEVKEFHNRAKHAAAGIKEHVASLGHEIHSVHHTSKAGDIGRLTGTHESQQQNSADIMVKTKSGHHLGYSLKVSDKKNQKVPIGNPGHGQTDKQLGVNTQHHYENARKELEKRHPELRGKSKSEQKKIVKANPKIHETAHELGTKAIGKIRDTWHKSLSSMPKKDLSNHIRNNLLHAHETKTPLYKSSSGGTGGDYSHHLTHPASQYNHLLSDHNNLHVEKSGHNSINFVHIHPKTGVKTLVVKHRIKPESTPVVTSLKGSAEGVH